MPHGTTVVKPDTAKANSGTSGSPPAFVALVIASQDHGNSHSQAAIVNVLQLQHL